MNSFHRVFGTVIRDPVHAAEPVHGTLLRIDGKTDTEWNCHTTEKRCIINNEGDDADAADLHFGWDHINISHYVKEY